jgi:hypothetical protein
MRVIYDKVSGGITEDTTIYGAIEGPSFVMSGVTVVLYGAVAGELVVDRDAQLALYGANAGSIINKGRVFAQGANVGKIQDVEGGESRVQLGEKFESSGGWPNWAEWGES